MINTHQSSGKERNGTPHGCSNKAAVSGHGPNCLVRLHLPLVRSGDLGQGFDDDIVRALACEIDWEIKGQWPSLED